MRCRITYFPCAVLLVVVALGSDTPRDYDDATKMDSIEGTWQKVTVENTGGTFYPPADRVTFRAGRYTWSGRDFHPLGYYKVNAAKTPAWLDMTQSDAPGADYAVKCIYRIDGDTLKIAWPLGDDGRAQIFEIKGDRRQSVSTFKRVK